MSDIFEEVDEEVRKDRLSELWKKYGIFAWLAMGAIIAAVALNEYRNYQAGQAAQARMLVVEDAIDAFDKGEYAKADTELQQLVDADGAISPLAAQYLAQSKITGSGDTEAAAAILVKQADATGTPYEKLALLKAAYIRADTATSAELKSLLGPLLTDEGSVGSLARELMAASAYAAGDIEYARTEFNRLKFEVNAPQGVVRRAELALAAMPAAAAPAPAPTPAEPDTQAPDTPAPDTPAPDTPAPDTPETTEETGQ